MREFALNPELGCYVVENCPLNCDGDGANGQTGGIACYVPEGSGLPHLDALENAGHPGDWWGIATCDGQPCLQGPNDPAPGAYISTTSYENRALAPNDPNRYLDAASVPFIVVPEHFRVLVPGVVMGCRCEVEYNGRVVPAMVGDVGPDFGEFSLAVCLQFDPSANCHATSIESGVTIRIWPGQAFPGYELQPA